MAAQELSRQSRNGRAAPDYSCGCRVVAAAMGQLMDTLAQALANDGASVPQPVAEAAVRLARRINHRSHDTMASSLDGMNLTTDPTLGHPFRIESTKPRRMR